MKKIWLLYALFLGFAQANYSECTALGERCIDGPSTKIIQGISVQKDCWQYEKTYACQEIDTNSACTTLARAECTQVDSVCAETATNGTCIKYKQTSDCSIDIQKANQAILPEGLTALPTQHLTQKSWDTRTCDAIAGQFNSCQTSDTTCTQGLETRNINGVAVSEACWQNTLTRTCLDPQPVNQCQALEEKGCTLKSEVCSETLADGTCQVTDKSYRCQATPAQTVTGNSCHDNDFAKAMTGLESAREAGRYFDPTTTKFFNGESSFCSIKLGGALDGVFGGDCCKLPDSNTDSLTDAAVMVGGEMAVSMAVSSMVSSYTYTVLTTTVSNGVSSAMSGIGSISGMGGGGFGAMGLSVSMNGPSLVVSFDPVSFAIAIAIYALQQWLACGPDETKAMMRKKAGLCLEFGSFCSSKFLGMCTTRKMAHCCFISKLARIINEAGYLQLGKSRGNPNNPVCEGFTSAELGQIDFGRIDMTEFLGDIVHKGPANDTMSNRVSNSGEKLLENPAAQLPQTPSGNYYDAPVSVGH